MHLRPDTLALTALLAFLTALGPLSTDMYLPSLPAIAAALGSKTKGKKVTSKTTAAKAPKAKRATAGKKVAPKYRDPANSANTWTGRGRMPQWVQALNTAGTLASALIPAAE